MFVTIFALVSFALSSVVIGCFVLAKAWNPDSYHWHSDALWGVEYSSPSSVEMKAINHARFEAQSRYQELIAASFDATALAAFVASPGLFFRRNWARLLIITVLAIAMLEVVLCTWLFWSLRMSVDFDYFVDFAVIGCLAVIVWKFHSPSIISEFRNARA